MPFGCRGFNTKAEKETLEEERKRSAEMMEELMALCKQLEQNSADLPTDEHKQNDK